MACQPQISPPASPDLDPKLIAPVAAPQDMGQGVVETPTDYIVTWEHSAPPNWEENGIGVSY